MWNKDSNPNNLQQDFSNKQEMYEGGNSQDQSPLSTKNDFSIEESKITLQFSSSEPTTITKNSIRYLQEKMQTCSKALQYAKLLI